MTDIELVIKIPEYVYKNILEIPPSSMFAVDCDMDIRKGIQNGVPLPKGHGRLIDADALIHWRRLESKSDKDIANAPIIIEADKGSEDKE